jgi:hypothetical protein
VIGAADFRLEEGAAQVAHGGFRGEREVDAPAEPAAIQRSISARRGARAVS